MKLHEYFAGLLADSVNLNQNRLDQLTGHEKAMVGLLRADSDFGSIMEGVSRQGSWAHRTIIKPLPGHEFDADLLVRMKRQRSWSTEPSRYLTTLHEAMLRSSRHRGMVELKSRCVRVTYAGDCHVDLVPCVRIPIYGIWDQEFIINRRADEFERVNPEGFVDWVRSKDRITHGNLRKSLRLLKYMRDYKGTFDVPSVILTVMVGSQANGLLASFDRYCDLPTAFHSLVTRSDQWMQQRWGVPRIKDPSCPSIDFGHRLDRAGFRKFRDQFQGYADAVHSAYRAKDRQDSIDLWQSVFGSAFAPRRRTGG